MYTKISKILSVVLLLAFLLGTSVVASAEPVQKNIGGGLHFQHAVYNEIVGHKFEVKLEDSAGAPVLPADAEFFIKKKQQSIASLVSTPTTVHSGKAEIHPKKAGKVTLYVVSPKEGNKVYAECTIRIVNNQFKWKMKKSNPVGSPVVESPARVYRTANGTTNGEIYLFNRSVKGGFKTIDTGAYELYMILVDKEAAHGSQIVEHSKKKLGAGEHTLKSKVKKGKAGLVKAEFPQEMKALNLTTGRYVPMLYTEGTMVARQFDLTIPAARFTVK